MLPVLGPQRLALAEHRPQLCFDSPLGQLVGRIDDHGWRRVLVDGAAQSVLHGRRAAHLGGLDKDDPLGGVVAEGVHDLGQIGSESVAPGA